MEAEENVLKARGSWDAPGFDACVDSEIERLRAIEQPADAPQVSLEAAAEALYPRVKHKIDPSWETFRTGKDFAEDYRHLLETASIALAAMPKQLAGDEAQEQVAALQRFKDYVHKRLDDAGIPTHPAGEHSEHGCRIGDRLDIALAPQHLSADIPMGKEARKEILEVMQRALYERENRDALNRSLPWEEAKGNPRHKAKQRASFTYRALRLAGYTIAKPQQ